ncbi:MAG TPA: hypothetical protein VMJ11_29390 [Paraburkholderia sp.]|uniref:hypothetical protein n=1 Tax=Paraburkholderia sp. TaxID=1926495 RepID=UPI002C24FEAC|nr:hypothetical protein [Paraburkholderia sp.]HTR10696.1 hypothetical protein [Paraburkholderia sp.]
MKPVKALVIANVVAGLFATTSAYAFSLSSVSSAIGGSSSSGSSSDAATDNLASQDALVKAFVASEIEVLTAQSLLEKAYGLKDDAAACDAQVKSLQSDGVDSDTIKKTVDLSNKANAVIAERQSKGASLSDEEKQYYIQSLPHFAKGIIGTHDVVSKAATFTAGLKNAGSNVGSLLSIGTSKLKSGLFIAESTPAYSKNLFDVFRKTVTIGQSNGVKVPADATSALGGLDG